MSGNLPCDIEWSSTRLVALINQPKYFLLAELCVATLERTSDVSDLACMHCWKEAALLKVQLFAEWDSL